MAAGVGSRRLAVLFRKDWLRSVEKVQPRNKRWIHSGRFGCCIPRTHSSSSVATSRWQQSRFCTTTVGANPSSKNTEETIDFGEDPEEEEVIEEPPGLLKRLWRWMHTDDDALHHEYNMSDEEKRERDELIARIQEFYFSDPPLEPDLDFWKDAIRTMIKYNDKLGVDVMYHIIPEMSFEPDEELLYMAETFLEECRQRELKE